MAEALIPAILGDAFALLAPPVREVHGRTGRRVFRGVAKIERGAGFLTRILCRIAGFPPAADGAPLRVVIRAVADRELWERDFDGTPFVSELVRGRGREADLLFDRFGFATLVCRLHVENGALVWRYDDVRVLGFSLPRFLRPRIHATAREEAGAYVFDAGLAMPGLGPVLRYGGRLFPEHKEQRHG